MFQIWRHHLTKRFLSQIIAHSTFKRLNRVRKIPGFVRTISTSNTLNSVPTTDRQLSMSSQTHNMSYTNCNTRIIDLKSLNLPDNATEAEYRSIYKSYIQAHPNSDLEAAVRSLTTGIAPPVAFPTETVYGLGADATNAPAVSGIFAAKSRPTDNPLIVHVASKDHLERLIGQPIPEIYDELVEKYWPGPLTILVPLPGANKVTFAHNVHPGQKTIGFRVPNSKYARFLISACDRPIAGPSANSSGRPSPTTAQHVLDDLNGKINFILDGGGCDVGVESTVVDGLSDPPTILRPGGVSRWDLVEFGHQTGTAWEGVVNGYNDHPYHHNDSTSQQQSEAPRAPGMKYKHYAPRGKLYLFDASLENPVTQFQQILTDHNTPAATTTPSPGELQISRTPEGRTNVTGRAPPPWTMIAILTTSTWTQRLDVPGQILPALSSAAATARPRVQKISLGTSATQIAQNLFSVLRNCDDIGADMIFVEAPARNTADGVEDKDWEVVMERLGKAAAGNTVLR